MEKHTELIREANKFLHNADHMTYTTYPLLQDPKLIVAIAENLYSALLLGIDALLHYEYYYKRIDYVPSDINDKIKSFKSNIVKMYKIDFEIMEHVEDLGKFVEFRKKSPLEFGKRDNFVIFNDRYSSKVINFKKIKEYLGASKTFIMKANEVLG